GTRASMGTRSDLWRYDDAGRHWPRPSLPGQGFSVGIMDGRCGRLDGTRGHHLGATPVHGYTGLLRSDTGGTWRSTRVHYGNPHRKIVRRSRNFGAYWNSSHSAVVSREPISGIDATLLPRVFTELDRLS